MATLSLSNIFGGAEQGYNSMAGTLLGGVPSEGAIGLGRLSNASGLALGRIDTQRFLADHPEFVEPYNNVVNSGQDAGKWLELAIQDATYIDPSSVPRGGGVADTVGALTNVASGLETGSNSAVRAGNLADVQNYGPGMAAAYRAANPGLTNSLNKADSLSSVSWQGPMSASGYSASTYAPSASIKADNVGMGMLGSSLYGQALGAGPTGVSSTLLGRAQGFANSTGQLTPDELRQVQQGTREAFAARGMEMSNPAMYAEVANRIGAQRDRMTQDLGMASALNSGYQQDLATNRGFASGIYGQELGRAFGNQGANLTASTANQSAFNQAGQFNASALNQAGMFNAQQAQQMALANSQLQLQQAGADRAYALGLVGAQGGAAYDPTRLLGATSGAPGMAGGILGAATGYSPDTSGLLSGAANISNDAAMTTYNAQMAAALAKKNNQAGLLGGLLGAAGSIFGGNIGGMIGSGVGGLLGGGSKSAPELDMSGLFNPAG
jgi:hypothetical protein